MPNSPDALRGVKRITKEELVIEKTLNPFEHFTPPDVPGDLSIKVFNLNPTKTYIVRIVEVAEFIKMPKRSK